MYEDAFPLATLYMTYGMDVRGVANLYPDIVVCDNVQSAPSRRSERLCADAQVVR
jgi:hypothetical protein